MKQCTCYLPVREPFLKGRVHIVMVDMYAMVFCMFIPDLNSCAVLDFRGAVTVHIGSTVTLQGVDKIVTWSVFCIMSLMYP